jgi:hypothetical protein
MKGKKLGKQVQHVRRVRTRKGVKKVMINLGIRKKKVKKRMGFVNIKGDWIPDTNPYAKKRSLANVDVLIMDNESPRSARNEPWDEGDEAYFRSVIEERKDLSEQLNKPEELPGSEDDAYARLNKLDKVIDSMAIRRVKKII